jgi:hypothetical protein
MRLWPSVLEAISIVLAFAAAVFWYLSAIGEIPTPVAYWDAAPKSDLFCAAIVQSTRWNRIAAGSTGTSVLMGAIAAIGRKRGNRSGRQ